MKPESSKVHDRAIVNYYTQYLSSSNDTDGLPNGSNSSYSESTSTLTASTARSSSATKSGSDGGSNSSSFNEERTYRSMSVDDLRKKISAMERAIEQKEGAPGAVVRFTRDKPPPPPPRSSRYHSNLYPPPPPPPPPPPRRSVSLDGNRRSSKTCLTVKGRSMSPGKRVRFENDLYNNPDLRVTAIIDKEQFRPHSPAPDANRDMAGDQCFARRRNSCDDVILSRVRTNERHCSLTSLMPDIYQGASRVEIARYEPPPPWNPRPYDVAGVTVYSPQDDGESNYCRSTSFEPQERNVIENRLVSSTTETEVKSKKNNHSDLTESIQRARNRSSKRKDSSSAKIDENGRCQRHPHIVLAQKRLFAKGWKRIQNCPWCEDEIYRRARSLSRDKRRGSIKSSCSVVSSMAYITPW